MIEWLFAVLGIIVIGVIAELLTSGGRLQNFIRGIYSVVAVFIIVSPLPNIMQGKFEYDFKYNDIVLDEEYIDSISAIKFGTLARATERALELEGIKGVTIIISGKYVAEPLIDKVNANIKNIVIINNDAHIDKYMLVQIKIAEMLQIPKEKVIVED